MSDFLLRKIQPEDNPAMAALIRQVMTEFGAVGNGFSIEDPEVDSMYEAYEDPQTVFYVVMMRGELVGGAGVAPLEGGEPDVCELKKMYFLPEARGRGAGKVLAELLINEAKLLGFRRIYVETLDRMQAANRLYSKLGFRPLETCLGNTGHHGCDRYYALDLGKPVQISIG